MGTDTVVRTDGGLLGLPHPEAWTMAQPVADGVSAVLKALSDPLRLRILAMLSSSPAGQARVSDICELGDVSAPTVSHHLKVLKDAGVLTSVRDASWVLYSVSPQFSPAVRALLETLVPAVRAGRAGVVSPIALVDVDRALTATALELAPRHQQVEMAVVLQTVRESYVALARSATVRTHLLPLTRRFADQRLHDLRRAARPHVGAPQVLFACVANAGRSQLAAALVEHYASGRVIVRSAGSTPAGAVHPTVFPLLGELGASADAFPKPLTDDVVRASDVVVTMGCGDVCPVLPGIQYEDWSVGDPAIASPEGLRAIRDEIDWRVRRLLATLVPDLELPSRLEARA